MDVNNNFSKSITRYPGFRPWVQKVMPGVYDDTLSYYELLAKVVAYINQMNDQQNEIIDWLETTVEAQNKDIEMLKKLFITFRGDMVRAFEEFKNDVTNTLLGEKVGEILEAWYEDGKLADIINKEVFDMKANKEDLDKLEQYVFDIGTSVRKFGAKGDGTTNDLNAFKETQLNGQTTIVPRGTYLIDGDLDLTRSIKGHGEGSVIVMKNGRIQVKADGVNISHLKIVSQMNNPINIHGESVDKRLKNVSIHDISTEHGETVSGNFMSVDVTNTEYLHIYNNKFTKGGLQLVQAKDFMIENNVFDGKEVNDNELIHASTHSNGQITNNLFLNSATDCIDMYTSGERCVVTNNRFNNIIMGGTKAGTVIELKITLRDAPFEGGSSDQPQYGSTESNVISNNVITGMKPIANGRFQAINASYYDFRASKTYDPAKTPRHIVISDNIIEDFNVSGSGELTGIYFNGILYQGINASIIGNIIRNIRTHGAPNWDTCGVKLGFKSGGDTFTTHGVVVSDNVISTEASGVVLEVVRDCVVSNNIMRADNKAGTELRYGVYISNSCDKTVVSNNAINCGQTGSNGLYALGGAVVKNCTFVGNTVTSIANTLAGIEGCSIANNMFNSTLSFGVATVKDFNKVFGNHFELNTNYGVVVDNQRGLVVVGNTFKNADHAVMLQNKTTYCNVDNNTTLQTGPVAVRYVGVSDDDKATTKEGTNILVK